MDAYCERIVWQVIPAIRRELAGVLLERGKSRKEVAQLLGISQAALTQYLKGKRGRFELPEWAKERIREYARRNPCIDMCEVCMLIRRDPRFAEIVPGIRRGCEDAQSER